MTQNPADALSDRIAHALADAIAAGEIAGGGMPDQFVLVASTIDSDGATLGLLDLGQAVWRSDGREQHES